MKMRERKKPGPKPLTVSLYPLTPEQALSAFLKVNPAKVKAAEQKAREKK